jgi:hypothetical protein
MRKISNKKYELFLISPATLPSSKSSFNGDQRPFARIVSALSPTPMRLTQPSLCSKRWTHCRPVTPISVGNAKQKSLPAKTTLFLSPAS